MNVECISVGTEILLGDILNTNVQFLSQTCARYGFDIYHTSVVGDNPQRLKEELVLATSRSDLIILTGGLGSTSDDITKRVVIDFLQVENVQNPTLRDRILQATRDENALPDDPIVYTFPANATILENKVGSAAGAWIPFQRNERSGFIVLLPGPPNEMEPMVEDALEPLLYEYAEGITKSLEVRIGVLGEHKINELLQDEIDHGTNPTIAPYVKPDGAMLRITAKSSYEREANLAISETMQTLKEKIGPYIVAIGSESRAEVLVQLLKYEGSQVAVAESITGGMVASTIIEVPGASEVLEQSFVVYSDRAKHKILTVPKKKLREYTAVSDVVCKSMLNGLYQRTGAELCIATTGYAGPTGEDVGHVFIGVMYHGKKYIFEHHLTGSRALIRNRAKNLAIDHAIMIVKKRGANGKNN